MSHTSSNRGLEGTNPGFFGAREKINIWVVVLLQLVAEKQLFILEDACALGAAISFETLGKRQQTQQRCGKSLTTAYMPITRGKTLTNRILYSYPK